MIGIIDPMAIVGLADSTHTTGKDPHYGAALNLISPVNERWLNIEADHGNAAAMPIQKPASAAPATRSIGGR
jgi:hypothetical protein